MKSVDTKNAKKHLCDGRCYVNSIIKKQEKKLQMLNFVFCNLLIHLENKNLFH